MALYIDQATKQRLQPQTVPDPAPQPIGSSQDEYQAGQAAFSGARGLPYIPPPMQQAPQPVPMGFGGPSYDDGYAPPQTGTIAPPEPSTWGNPFGGYGQTVAQNPWQPQPYDTGYAPPVEAYPSQGGPAGPYSLGNVAGGVAGAGLGFAGLGALTIAGMAKSNYDNTLGRVAPNIAGDVGGIFGRMGQFGNYLPIGTENQQAVNQWVGQQGVAGEALNQIPQWVTGGAELGPLRTGLGIAGQIAAERGANALPNDTPYVGSIRAVAPFVGGSIGAAGPEIANLARSGASALDRFVSPAVLPREASQIGRIPGTDSLFTAGPQGEVVGPTGNVAELRLGREPVMGEDVNAGLRRTAYGRAQQEQLAAEEQAAFRDAGERAISGAVPDGGTPAMGGAPTGGEVPLTPRPEEIAALQAKLASGEPLTAEERATALNALGQTWGAIPTAEQVAAREAFYRDPANLGGGQGLSTEAQQATEDLVKRADQRNTITDALANAREPDPFARFETPNPDTLPEPNRTQPPPGYLDRFRQPPAGGADIPGSQPPMAPRGGTNLPTGIPTGSVTPQSVTTGDVRASLARDAVAPLEKPSLLNQVSDVANLPRTVLTSFDLSAPFRQGAMLIGHPREFGGAMVPMLKAFASEGAAQEVDTAIRSGARGTIKEQAGLYLSPLGDAAGALSTREEAYMSRLAGKIPGVAGSERAYATFLNKVRSDVFDHFWEGLPFEAQTSENAARYAHFINAATGRGSIPNALKDLAPALNAAFFSPRYFISRFESNGMGALAIGDLAKSAVTRQTLDPVSKAIAGDVLKFYATGLTALGLAKMAGASVEADPRSSDFGKIRVGDTRYDVWAGNQQIARFIATEYSGQHKVNGADVQYGRNTAALNFLRSKLGPVTGLGWDVLKGTTPIGDKVEATPASLKRILFNEFVPMIVQDITDGVQTSGVAGGLKALPTILGVGTQTYAATQPKGAKGGLPKITPPKTTLPKLALPKIAKP